MFGELSKFPEHGRWLIFMFGELSKFPEHGQWLISCSGNFQSSRTSAVVDFNVRGTSKVPRTSAEAIALFEIYGLLDSVK